jgi:hypothetical protein
MRTILIRGAKRFFAHLVVVAGIILAFACGIAAVSPLHFGGFSFGGALCAGCNRRQGPGGRTASC